MDIETFIQRWRDNEGGAERANFPLFLNELAEILGLPRPDPAGATHANNDYVFERAVDFKDEAGRSGHGRIDLYKRGCFVLEAKQSRERGGAKEVTLPAEQAALPGMALPTPDSGSTRGRRSAHRGWDVLMRNAREQAEQYARALPTEHGWPPFILVCDVGHAIEVFADFSGQGKNYRQFPDRAGFRIYLDDLRNTDVQDRLRAIWNDPHSLDPAKRSAAVTRDIAKRLASVSKLLEERGYQPEPVAHFLMRCLFTMFAEDTGLLERGSFTEVLSEARTNPESFAPMLEELWCAMDVGAFSTTLRRKMRHFNGGLFAERSAIPLRKEEIGELFEAARHDWTEVEPAIFGTLLEQALDKEERKRLGAHYTPRAYVERLVNATVIDPLQSEWQEVVLGTVERERESDRQAAIRAVHDFHEKLTATRVLDPACGTGNFLYVALELMKRLEGDVLEVLLDLGGQEALALETSTVHPRNFLGMELNPRAAAIAELVLWLGYLQWQMRNGTSISDPVLEKLSNIVAMDAVVKHDGERPNADRSATELANPRRPDWPEADYIVGNPPFIGKGSALRSALGDAYVHALWKANPKVNKSADFVMYWWDRAADLLTRKGTRLKRFGFVTTNSITQEFSRRVIAKYLDGHSPISLVLAIPDHPWTKATRDTAAVRIAMTVAMAGKCEGRIFLVTSEAALDTDSPALEFDSRIGEIHADLTIGADATNVAVLKSNFGIAYNGMMLAAQGFKLDKSTADHFLSSTNSWSKTLIRPYINGSALVQKRPPSFVIDTANIEIDSIRRNAPEIYQHLLQTVKKEREGRRDVTFREQWWKFGRIRPELRAALSEIPRYIATTETTKHRTFQFLDCALVPDHMVIAIGSGDAFHLGVLSSNIHVQWSLHTGGWLGVGNDPRYSKSKVFDPFPFPDASPEQRRSIGALAEELDAVRKDVLARHADLTLTGLYNLRDKLRKGEPLDIVEQDQRQRGLIDLIAELHDRIDAAVADAYGWPRDLSDDQIVARLVALNAERHAEEQRGIVRWLRPEYQIAKAGVVELRPAEGATQLEAALPEMAARKPQFPREAIGQTAAVIAALRDGKPDAETIARAHAQGMRIAPRVQKTLDALERLGHVHYLGGAYALRKAA